MNRDEGKIVTRFQKVGWEGRLMSMFLCNNCAGEGDGKNAETFDAEERDFFKESGGETNGDFKKGMQMGAGAILGIMGIQLVVGGLLYGALSIMGKDELI